MYAPSRKNYSKSLVPSSASSTTASKTTEHYNHRAEEELVDPKKYLEKRCQPKCVRPLYEYRECVKRIQSDKTGNKHCTGQYFDYWACIDKCIALMACCEPPIRKTAREEQLSATAHSFRNRDTLWASWFVAAQ